MVLIDYSSIVHRKIYTSVKHANPSKINEQYITKDFINLTKYYILQEIFDIKREFENKFGDLIIALDSPKKCWRKDFFHGYKLNRKKLRAKSEIDFPSVFEEIDILTDQIRKNLPIKVVKVHHAEADDLILALAKKFNQYENILILSPDKDFLQAQRDNDTVFQYSSLTQKYLTPEDKHANVSHWLEEHVCLGDVSDGIPKIVDNTEFSTAFLSMLEKSNFGHIKTPQEFKETDTIDNSKKVEVIKNFDVYKLNQKKESTEEKDIYKKMNFGPSKLKKTIEKFGGLQKWLDANPEYKKNYERNFKLVMSEGIPTSIWNESIVNFKEASTVYNDKEFKEYLIENSLKNILMDLPSIFKTERNLITAEDFGW